MVLPAAKPQVRSSNSNTSKGKVQGGFGSWLMFTKTALEDKNEDTYARINAAAAMSETSRQM